MTAPPADGLPGIHAVRAPGRGRSQHASVHGPPAGRHRAASLVGSGADACAWACGRL